MTHSHDPFAGIPEFDQDSQVATNQYANDTHAFYAGETNADAFPHKCAKCNGTGVFKWFSVNTGPQQGKCHSCNGNGGFKTSAADRAKAKADRRRKKMNEWIDFRNALNEAEYAALAWLRGQVQYNGYHGRSQFAQNMYEYINNKRPLSPKMVAAILSMHQTEIKRQAEREAEKQAEQVVGAVSNKFQALFDAFAQTEGKLKRPIFRACGIRIERAPEGGVNAGYLYVKDDAEHFEDRKYLGKITPSGEFKGRASDEQLKSLDEVAADPFSATLKYGRVTGRCGCCGKELTKHASIEDGIGPICKDKWGF